MSEDFVAGIDAGGSKTTVAVSLPTGETLKKQFGAFNINGQSVDITSQTIKDISVWLNTMPGGLNKCKALCIGAAGISNPSTSKLIGKLLLEVNYNGKLKLVGDGEVALFSAFENKEGIVLIAGTGSICYGQNAFKQNARAGGWGQLIDDEGSGYALARDALAAVMRAEDGRLQNTLLTKLILTRLALQNAADIPSWLYAKERTKKDIASLSICLETAANQGDAAAVAIVQKAAKELLSLVCAVAKKLDMAAGKVALAGSILQKDANMQAAFIKECEIALPKFIPFVLKAKAEDGAVSLAQQMLR